MRKKAERPEIPLEVEYTDGYQERFAAALLKIYAKRISRQEEQESEPDREIQATG